MEFWTSAVGRPADVARRAAQLEEAGWDGMTVPYAPTRAPDPYVCLAAAARTTSRLLLATGVATPASHTPAATATAIASVQMEAGGRAVLGLGRGDSALAYMGMAPAPPQFFDRFAGRVRGYLTGEPQQFDLDLEGGGHFPLLDALRLAEAPTESKFGLFMADVPRVPLDVVASGPKVIAIAARHADRVSFAVGAEPTRVQWALDAARRVRVEESVRRPVAFGAWVPVAVVDDRSDGRRMLSGAIASMSRFSSMHGPPTAPMSETDRELYTRVHDAYQMSAHFREGSPQSTQLTQEFVDRFAVIGSARLCIERLRLLVDLGIERFVFATPSAATTPELAQRSTQMIAEEVLPALRA